MLSSTKGSYPLMEVMAYRTETFFFERRGFWDLGPRKGLEGTAGERPRECIFGPVFLLDL
jgi:hypothetical protein